MERPMTDLFTTTSELRGRSTSRANSALTKQLEEAHLNADTAGHNKLRVSGVENGRVTLKVMGHPCAAGCGHYCWVSSERFGAGVDI